jgi:hypothetical protein
MTVVFITLFSFFLTPGSAQLAIQWMQKATYPGRKQVELE